jgi:hypothetical protein
MQEFFQEIGNMQQFVNKTDNKDDEIQNSQYEDNAESTSFNPFVSSLQDNKEYHYIDILSIIQIINTPKKDDK